MDQLLPTEPGIYPGIPEDVYFAIDAVSRSQLEYIGIGPGFRPDRYRAYADNPNLTRRSEPVYSANHCRFFQPELFYERYTVAERRSKDNPYRLNVTDCDLIEKWEQAREASREVRALKSKIHYSELTLIWLDASQIKRKARLDALLMPRYRTVIDLKVVPQIDDEWELSSYIYRQGYHRQGATYLAACNALGFEVENFVLLCQETSVPYACRIFPLAAEYLDIGRRQVAAQMQELARCLESDVWAPRFEACLEIDPPRWVQALEGAING